MQKNTDTPTASLITKQNLDAVTKFIPYFKTKDQENHKFDTNSLPDPNKHSEKIANFISVLEKNNFLVPLNWQEWIPEAEKIHNNPNSFEILDLATITKLFTLYVTADRFMSGYLNAVIERGYVLMLLKRIKEISKKT